MSTEEQRIPRVSTRKRGRVNNTLERIAQVFIENNPGWTCRWTYDPTHKPELSKVMSKMAEGYRCVKSEELQDEEAVELLGLEEGARVRVADVVLMKISAEDAAEIKADVRQTADDQRNKIDREYYANINAISMGGEDEDNPNRRLDARHKPRPMGRAVIEEREFEYDLEQPTGREE